MSTEKLVSGQITGVIEITNRHGHVLHRHSWDGTPVRIGRAYDNDLVVADPYVCPHHLQVTLEETGPLVTDLGSLNGTYLGHNKTRLESLVLQDGMSLHFGHSQLLYHPGDSALVPTLRDNARLGVLSAMGKPWVMILMAALALLTLFASELLADPGKLGPLGIVEEMAYPLIGVLAWAGFWALLNRIAVHRSHFLVHLAISFAGVAGLFLVSQTVSAVGFALDLGNAVWWMKWLGRISVLGLVVLAHLRYVSQAPLRRQLTLASIAAVVLFGAPAVGSFIEKNNFSSLPILDPLLRPPAFQFRRGVSAEEFMLRAADLRDLADEEAKD
jgi:hypothetical protein